MENFNIILDNFSEDELFCLNSKNTDNLFLDFCKGFSIKKLSIKYNLPIDVLNKIYRDNLVFINKNRTIDYLDVIIDYNSGVSVKEIANNLNVNVRLIEDIVNKNNVNAIINKKLSKIVKPFKLESNNNLFKLISDLYQCGSSISYMEKNYGISSSASYYGSLEVSSSNKITNSKDLAIYQYIISEAYDNSIINNENLNILFNMSKEEVDNLRTTSKSFNDFVNNKLYQIYYTPSLLYGINFTDDDIKVKAEQFINRRYGEEIVSLKKKNRFNQVNIDNLEKAKTMALSTESIPERIKYIEERYDKLLEKLQSSNSNVLQNIKQKAKLYYETKSRI
ncbi:MAG: hypothetical protein ACI4OT_04550 [Bacilli bacterium]